MLNQCARVLRHLKDYGSITAMEAMQEYSIMRLASRISDLKAQGYSIKREIITDKNRYLLDYIGGINRGTDYSNVSYRLDQIRCFDRKGNPTSDELGACEAWIPNYQKEITEAAGKTGIKSSIVCDETGAVTIDFGTSLSLNKAVSNIKKIYRACRFEDGRMRGIYFRAKNLTVSLDKTTETYDGYALTATASGEDGTPDESMQTQLLKRLSDLNGISSGTGASEKKE